MQLYCTITANAGKRVPLLLKETTITPTELRKRVSETTKIPLKDLRLIFRGRMIKDDDSVPSVVNEYKLETDSVLHCMGKPVENSNNNGASNGNSNGNAASIPAASTDTTTVPNRTVVPPLSTPIATASAPPPSSSSSSSSATATATSTAGDPLTRALARLKQNNPPSVYTTAVGTLEKVLTNIAGNPMEEKYRRVKRGNAAFGKRLGKLVGGHDCMLATGFVVEMFGGDGGDGEEEVYQLHASPEKWNALLFAKSRVAEASRQAKRDQERGRQPPPPTPFSGGSPFPSVPGFGAGGRQGVPNMNDPNIQNMMSQMMSNPEALGQALQNPMVREMMRNDPNVSPMMRQQMETVANNPAMLQQMAQRMQDPAVRAQLERAMQSGGIPGMGGVPGMGGGAVNNNNNNNTTTTTAAIPPPPPQNDQGQTEEEMIAEAIRRSLQDN